MKDLLRSLFYVTRLMDTELQAYWERGGETNEEEADCYGGSRNDAPYRL